MNPPYTSLAILSATMVPTYRQARNLHGFTFAGPMVKGKIFTMGKQMLPGWERIVVSKAFVKPVGFL
jgi:hypothetical protein